MASPSTGNARHGVLGAPRVRPLVLAGVVLGLGLGGFVDGILFHQILQWHHMASSHADPAVANDVGLNVTLDGFFHVVTWLLVVTGVLLLYRAWRQPDVPRSGRVLAGSMLAGAGLFNLVEGLIDHQILRVHHVWPAGPGGVWVWDLAYLALGVLLVLAGWGVARSDRDAWHARERATAARSI